jgi:hypothetical protein
MPDPPPDRLRVALEKHPEARPRLGRALATLLGVGVGCIGILGALILWHLVRRGRLIREGLKPPREARLPDLGTSEPERDRREP